jgi:sulfate transport system permease protein
MPLQPAAALTSACAGWRRQAAPARRVLPGFNLTLGYTLFYLSLIVLIPLSALVFKTFTLSWEQFWAAVSSPRVLASYRLTFGASFIAALVNLVFGLLVAWVLVRYSFPGKKIVDALVDLPFALPTAVAGISLTALLAGNGWVGQILEPMGIQLAFKPNGVVIALIFIGLPFVVRTVQPVLEDAEKELEEAACAWVPRAADLSAGDPAGHPAGAADRLCHGLCARHR